MNPYYVADKAAGRITEDEAIELIQCFFIKMTDVMKLRDKFYSQSFAGYPLWQNIIIGGQTPDGKDATNETSFLCLKANAGVQTSQPTMSVRYFKGLNEDEGTAASSSSLADSGGTEDDPGRYGHPRVLQR